MVSAGLLSALAASARAEASQLLRVAQAEAEAIAREAARRRALLRARAKSEADVEFAAALEGEVRAARREAAARSLEDRQRFLEEVYRRVLARLPGAVETEEYRAGLKARLSEALGYAPPGATVRCAPVLLEPLRDLTRGGVAVETDAAIDDGFEVVAQAGATRVDARLSTELCRRWPALAVELVREAGR